MARAVVMSITVVAAGVQVAMVIAVAAIIVAIVCAVAFVRGVHCGRRAGSWTEAWVLAPGSREPAAKRMKECRAKAGATAKAQAAIKKKSRRREKEHQKHGHAASGAPGPRFFWFEEQGRMSERNDGSDARVSASIGTMHCNRLFAWLGHGAYAQVPLHMPPSLVAAALRTAGAAAAFLGSVLLDLMRIALCALRGNSVSNHARTKARLCVQPVLL